KEGVFARPDSFGDVKSRRVAGQGGVHKAAKNRNDGLRLRRQILRLIVISAIEILVPLVTGSFRGKNTGAALVGGAHPDGGRRKVGRERRGDGDKIRILA